MSRYFRPLDRSGDGFYHLRLGDVRVRHTYGPTTDIVGRKLRLVGFVSRDEQSPPGANAFTLTRFRILCCAADGIAMHLNATVDDGISVPPIDSWVEVVATFVDPTTPVPANGRVDRALVRALSINQIKRPADPFE